MSQRWIIGTYGPSVSWDWQRRGYYEEADTCEWFIAHGEPTWRPEALWGATYTGRYCHLLTVYGDYVPDQSWSRSDDSNMDDSVRYYTKQSDEEPEQIAIPEPVDDQVCQAIIDTHDGTTEGYRSLIEMARTEMDRAIQEIHERDYENFTVFRQMFTEN